MSDQISTELCSWKEIAAYLDVSVRTAQLWESQRGLPVRRLPGPRTQVRASREDLEAWKRGGIDGKSEEQEALAAAPAGPVDESEPRRFVSRGALRAAAIVVAFLAALGLFAIGWNRPVLAAVRVENETLLGLDEEGGVLWRHLAPGIDARRYFDGERHTWVGTLGGRRVALFVPIVSGGVREPVPLIALDARGREQWRFIPGKAVRRKNETFEPPFVVRQFEVMGDQVIVTSHHHLYYPSQIAVLSADGQKVREYWHPGHLNVMTPGTYRGKSVVFLGGVNNVQRAATIVVLDPKRLGGAALDNDGPAFQNIAAGQEEARILFRRSCRSDPDRYNGVQQMFVREEGLIVDVRERPSDERSPSVQYHFDRDLRLEDVALSDVFLSEHAGRARHELTAAEQAELRKLTVVRGTTDRLN